MGVVGLRTVHELHGFVCHALEDQAMAMPGGRHLPMHPVGNADLGSIDYLIRL
ncbi:hypothetical protein OLX02_18800 [Novosphingobium sp. KCTC 2891]|nr:hypothetical protein [Novosphingobium sp. KCTC 2891]